MDSPLAYLILNCLLLLFALRNFQGANSRIKHLFSVPGSYRPWQYEHRAVLEDYQSARIMLLTIAAWVAIGQWVLLAGVVESGI
jgi:hypothetical protein